MNQAVPAYPVLLRTLFDCAIDAVSAQRVLPSHLPPPPTGRTVMLAVGKAASAMAQVAALNWRGPLSGLVVTRYGHTLERLPDHVDIELVEAGHPVPDRNSVIGARRALELVQGLGTDDLVLVLVSGGGSSLWCLPIDGIDLSQKQEITSSLLRGGATVNELNTVRKWLSQIKGGRLAAAASPARVDTLIISDVVNNDPSLIASGPTVYRSGTFDEFTKILARYDLKLPDDVLASIRKSGLAVGDHGDRPENRCELVAVPDDALSAAASHAESLGFDVYSLGDAIEGEASKAAAEQARIARAVARRGKPTAILSGGEVTVTVRNSNGVGGPNTEFLLALAIALDGAAGIHALACDTDGYDGVGNNAGAIVTPDTLERARRLGLDPRRALADNDSSRFFDALGDLVITGPTQTNVSDFRAILVHPD